jgi:hypothetical protein
MAEGVYEGITVTVKTSKRIAPIAFVYAAITRPELLASAGGWIAEQLGLPWLVGVFAVYFIGIFAVLEFFWPLLWCGRIVAWLFRRLRHISEFCSRRSPRAQAVFGAVASQ